MNVRTLASSTLVTLLLAACGGVSGGGSDGGPSGSAGTTGADGNAAVCTPGATQLCVGPGACNGAQSCTPSGSGWQPCDCGSTAGTTGRGGTTGSAGTGGAAGATGSAGSTGGGGTTGSAGATGSAGTGGTNAGTSGTGGGGGRGGGAGTATAGTGGRGGGAGTATPGDGGRGGGAGAGAGGAGGRGGAAGTGTAGTAGTGGAGGGSAGAAGGGTGGPAVGGSGGASGSGGTGGSGTPVVINFDNQPDGPLSSAYAGLTWDSDWYVYHSSEPSYRAHSGSQFITNLSVWPMLSFTFPTPVHFLGAWFSHAMGARIRLEAYDAGGVLIGASPTVAQTLVPAFLSLDARGAKKIVVIYQQSTGGFDDFSMDDVTYILE